MLSLCGDVMASLESFAGGLRRTHGGQNAQWKVGVGGGHLLGYRVCQEEPTGGDDQDILLQRLDKYNHQLLKLSINHLITNVNCQVPR